MIPAEAWPGEVDFAQLGDFLSDNLAWSASIRVSRGGFLAAQKGVNGVAASVHSAVAALRVFEGVGVLNFGGGSSGG